MSESSNVAMLTGMLVLIVLVVAGLTASSINGAYKQQSITSIYFKILMNYIQIVTLTISFNLDWPSLVKSMFSVQSQAGNSDQLFSIDCFLSSQTNPYYAKLVMLDVIPLVCGLLSVVF